MSILDGFDGRILGRLRSTFRRLRDAGGERGIKHRAAGVGLRLREDPGGVGGVDRGHRLRRAEPDTHFLGGQVGVRQRLHDVVMHGLEHDRRRGRGRRHARGASGGSGGVFRVGHWLFLSRCVVATKTSSIIGELVSIEWKK